MFARDLVHEFTHFCQDKYSVNSKKDSLKSVAGNAMLSNEVKSNTFDAAVLAGTKYICAAIRDLQIRNRDSGINDIANISSAASECLDTVILPVTKGDMPRYCRRMLNKAMNDEEMPQNIDRGYVIKYLLNGAKGEVQAYQKGNAVYKKCMKDDRSIGYDMFTVMYQNLAGTCK